MSSANPTQDTGLSHYLSATMFTFQVSSHPHSHRTPHLLARGGIAIQGPGADSHPQETGGLWVWVPGPRNGAQLISCAPSKGPGPRTRSSPQRASVSS